MVIDLPLETSTVAFTLCNVIGDSNIPIAIIDDVNKGVSSTIFKKQKLPAAYKAPQEIRVQLHKLRLEIGR
jgi:hypothetical protein